MAMTQAPQSGPMEMPQPQATVLQPVPYIGSQQLSPSSHPRQKYKKVIFSMGIVEIVMGTISLILGIAAAAVGSVRENAYHNNYNYYYGQNYYIPYYNYYCRAAASWSFIAPGIWSGLFLVVTGILGVLLVKKTSRGMYIANMAMAIISANIVVAGMVLSAIAGAASGTCDGALLGMHVVVAILCFTAIIITILHASFCCTGVCYKDDAKKTQKFQYMPQQSVGYVQPQYVQGPNGQMLLVTTPLTTVTHQQSPLAYPPNPTDGKEKMQVGVTQA